MSVSPSSCQQRAAKQDSYDQYFKKTRLIIAHCTLKGMIGGFIMGGLYDLSQWATGEEVSFAAIRLPSYVFLGGVAAFLASPAGYFPSQKPEFWKNRSVIHQS